MVPKERRSTGQQDLFRSRLDQIVDMKHPLAKLGGLVDWAFLEKTFGAVYSDGPGQPPLPTRLMAGLAILKHTYNLSDEALCERWIENPYYQLFCGEEFFRHDWPFDRSSLTRWRQRMGEEKIAALIQESLGVATRTGAAKPSDFAKVVVDTTVQPKAVMFPTDTKLMQRAREKLVKLAKKRGVKLRQSFERVGKYALIAHQRYAHAKQFKRANRELRKLRTYLGRVRRDIMRIVADRGYRGHNAPPSHKFKVFITEQKRGMTKAIKREMRRRAAVEPVIGHAKADHRMDRNHLAGSHGDAINAVLAGAGYNFRRIIAWLRRFWRVLCALCAAIAASREEPFVLIRA